MAQYETGEHGLGGIFGLEGLGAAEDGLGAGGALGLGEVGRGGERRGGEGDDVLGGEVGLGEGFGPGGLGGRWVKLLV